MLKRLSGGHETYLLYSTLGFVVAQVCISGWSTFRFLERTGAGEAELVGVVGSEFQAARIVSPVGKPVARLCWLAALQCLIKCRTCCVHSYIISDLSLVSQSKLVLDNSLLGIRVLW